MEWLILLFSILFYGATLWSYDASQADFIFQLVTGTVLLGFFLYLLRDRREQEEFVLWLHSNRTEILTGRAFFHHLEITPETKFIRYEAVISFALFSSYRKSRYLIEGGHFTLIHKTMFILITLLFGWWSVPFGPFTTIVVLWRNLRGGHRHTLSTIHE
ncbi:hypothetical protein PCCS19_36610 [Paenibacillus sp. CCS19]|uniref:hypothetical protein n=1 Tax=Paenibacillus sp. CCS19 TaxID=3158387 RepID=UPI0025648383|nr:hypothetical protein [Paenibacillus cellulosilyticus]GMK40605.1 hypothetical protein PCCS19_36610 [Paenibacillus cellulosilyticus]